ncbi:MAG: helix-turn-helix transcriptional regulator [Armatimonadetes bacterium]|nr:helix-turn-helix transcriptional regulator [Armatimonadota bacterium]
MATDVRSLREKLGWSQERLARELGVSFSTISRWERGQGEPSPMAEKLLQELSRRVAAESWPTADQIDISPIVGLFKGPRDLSTRHHHYLDPDAR